MTRSGSRVGAVEGLPANKIRRIFVSYRRSDTGGHVGLLVNYLRQRRGIRAVFCDVDEIKVGERFENRIGVEIARCAVILVIIGPDWLTITREGGTRPRLEESGDVVHAEVLAALTSRAKLVPVLVGGAGMPTVNQLKDLGPLAALNAFTFLHGSGKEWEKEVGRLWRDIARSYWDASPVRGWLEAWSAVQAALFVATAAMVFATLLRAVAPLHLFVESMLAWVVAAFAVPTALVVWNGWHPGSRYVRELSVWTTLALLLSLPVLWTSYRSFRPVVLTVEEWPTTPISCTGHFAQPYRLAFSRGQPADEDLNRSLCEREFNRQFQLATIRRGLVRLGNSVATVEVTDGLGHIGALLVSDANRPDFLSEGDSLPPPPERVSLPVRGGDPYRVGFRVVSSVESVRAVVTLTSPFGWRAGKESLDVTTYLLPRVDSASARDGHK